MDLVITPLSNDSHRGISKSIAATEPATEVTPEFCTRWFGKNREGVIIDLDKLPAGTKHVLVYIKQ